MPAPPPSELRLVAAARSSAGVVDLSDDTETVRVFDAIADALIGVLARQAAREDFEAENASQKGRP